MITDASAVLRDKPILLTGATGFVGRHLRPALLAAGYRVRCASRNPSGRFSSHPAEEWTYLDVNRTDTLAAALDGCGAAYYLVHALHGERDYPATEARAASGFARAAGNAGLRRVVYLGGMMPRGPASRHLESRARVGALLRGGAVPTVELRAALIIGRGGESWQIVRDLARRLPAMVLPRWLENHTWPIAIDDAVVALIAALAVPLSPTGYYEIPGAERVSHAELLQRTSGYFRRRTAMIRVPLLTPKLSTYWIRLVSRADFALAVELVRGARYDLDPLGPILWSQITGFQPMPLDMAIENALEDELASGPPSPATLQRVTRLGAAYAPA